MLTPGLRLRGRTTAAAAAEAAGLVEVEVSALVISGTPTISICREERTAMTPTTNGGYLVEDLVLKRFRVRACTMTNRTKLDCIGRGS